MGRARVGVPPGERRLRAAHVERVGAAAVGAGGGVIAGKGGGGAGALYRGRPAREGSFRDAVFCARRVAAVRSGRKSPNVTLSNSARGVQEAQSYTPNLSKWTVSWWPLEEACA